MHIIGSVFVSCTGKGLTENFMLPLEAAEGLAKYVLNPGNEERKIVTGKKEAAADEFAEVVKQFNLRKYFENKA